MRGLIIAGLFLSIFGLTVVAQTQGEVAVSLKTPEGKFVGQVAGGGLDATSATVTAKQTFALSDLNGGKIADGDKIKLRMDASLWHEDKEKGLIHRVPVKGAKEEECHFKIRVKDKLIFLETSSGKFVKADGATVTTVADAKNATLFDIQTVTDAGPDTVIYTTGIKVASASHIGMVANGGLDASSKVITANQVFDLIDLNGGKLVSGDSVKLIFGQSQFREDKENNRIHRVPIRGAKDGECVFKLIIVGANFRLQTPSGKFVAAAVDGKSLIATDKQDESSLLTAIPNPTPITK